MPWTVDDVDEHNQGLSDEQKRQWVAVANAVLARCQQEGGSDCEASAIRQANAAVKKQAWSREVGIIKRDDDQQLVFGWLSVSEDAAGNRVVDKQEDIISPAELERAAYNHVLYFREGAEMHKKRGVGRLVESMVFTVEKQQALGIPPNTVPVGWWVGYHIADPEVWQKVKSGEYTAFSIGGSGRRKEVAIET